tara:strand:+ start:341 stop:448 length:108 start_codon:yes stop_codon:yes gene_type:complete
MESQSEFIAFKEGVKNFDFDTNLGAYPVDENYSKW